MRRKKVIRPKLPTAKPENYFVLVSGIPLKNIKELASSLESMNDWVFSHHVNESRNDFSAWINDVFKEPMLAQDISMIKDIREMENVLHRYLVRKYV